MNINTHIKFDIEKWLEENHQLMVDAMMDQILQTENYSANDALSKLINDIKVSDKLTSTYNLKNVRHYVKRSNIFNVIEYTPETEQEIKEHIQKYSVINVADMKYGDFIIININNNNVQTIEHVIKIGKPNLSQFVEINFV